MENSKICSSCGNTLPFDAMFCPNCGSKQSAPESMVQIPEEKKEVFPVSESVHNEATVNIAKQEPASVQPAPAQPAVQQAPVQPAPVAPQPAYQPVQPATNYQQQYYGQPAQPAAPPKPKKKFPWVFTVLWVGMLAYLGVWGFFFMDPNYEGPVITVDTIRVVTFAASVILLIYTLNLKIVTKKLKVLPTILLAIFLLISVFMFCSFELIDGDPVHDVISPITDSIFQIN